MLTIYTNTGNIRHQTPINIGSSRERKLMGDDYVKIVFSAAAPIRFELGDYCDIPGEGRFVLCSPYNPAKNADTGGYDYELRLEAQYVKWRNKIMRYSPQFGASETSFTLTATADTHLSLIQANVNALGGQDARYLYNGTRQWTVSRGTDVEASAKTIAYENVNIIDALASIAETFETEWWIEDNIIHLGQCENGSYIDLEEDVNASVTRSDSKETLATRIIPFGGDRNIPERYRKVLIFNVTSTEEDGNIISDATRVLSAEWFEESLRRTRLDQAANEPAVKVVGITVEKIGTDGSVLATYTDAEFNPQWWVSGTEVNTIKLPSGARMSVGDRYTVRGLIESKVKSSYFTSRQNAYTSGWILANGIVANRLMLPESYGKSYVDCADGQSTESSIETVVVFDDVYPQADCTVTSVSTVERKESSENDDGSQSAGTFIAYRVKDSLFTSEHPFDTDYIIPGKTLEITFGDGRRYKDGDDIPSGKSVGDLVNPESGKLNGWTFEAQFNKDEDGSAIWEIVRDDNSYVPNEYIHPEIGDTFVLTGCDISVVSDVYVGAAEAKLLETARKYAKELNTDPSTYKCAIFPDLAKDGLMPGLGRRVNLISGTFLETTIDGEGKRWGRKSRVIGYSYPLDIPYDNPIYTVGEKAQYSRFGDIEDKLKGLSMSMQAVSGTSSGGQSIYIVRTNDPTPATDSNIFSALRSKKEFISRTGNDSADGVITFKKWIEFGSYLAGSTGAFMGMTEAGSASEVDFLKVRKKAQFETLEIAQVNYIGGKLVVSPGDGVEITAVEDADDSYRCYFKGEEQEQEGTSRKVSNKFSVGDQIYCRATNILDGDTLSERYWWRLCTATGDGWFDLSKVDADGPDAPIAGDKCAQLGNRTDKTRQSSIVLSTIEQGQSPVLALYSGINSYSLEGRDAVSMGADAEGVAFMNVYGKFYSGARDKSSFIQFVPGEGVTIKGKILAESTIGDQTLEQYINSVAGSSEDMQAYVDAVIGDAKDELQSQIDGAIETWYLQGVPTLSNAPASDWTTNDDKDRHIGDLYYDKDTGYAYRFLKDGGAYSWVRITDTDIASALAAANAAQDTADHKRRVFVATPTPPYDKGDIWVNATYTGTFNNDIARCKTARASGPFSIGDWELASKYTDDTAAQAAAAAAAQAAQDAQDAQDAADAAATAADAAAAAVTNLNTYVNGAFKDGVISEDEAAGIQRYLNTLASTKAQVDATYTTLYTNAHLSGTAKSSLNTKYNSVNTAYTALTDAIADAIADGKATAAETADVNSKFSDFNTTLSDFSAAVETANKAIQDKIKEYADAAQATANSALAEAQKYSYLSEALREITSIDGGLILSGLISLGTDNTNPASHTSWSGLNGIIPSGYDAAGTNWNPTTNSTANLPAPISYWGGGDMVDLALYYYWDSTNRKWTLKTGATAPSRMAQAVDRMDGTGYRAGGNLWWDKNGNVHADPMSFFVGENTVGNVLQLFTYNPANNLAWSEVKSATPTRPFTELEISNEGATSKIKISYDSSADAIHIHGNIYADGFVSALGASSGAAAASGTLEGLTDTQLTNLKAGQVLVYSTSGKWVNVDQSTLQPDLSGYLTSVSWSDITNKPTWIGASKPSYTTDEVTEGNNKYFTAQRVKDVVTTAYVNGLGIDAATLGGTAKGDLLTAVTASGGTIGVTVGGKALSATASGTWGISISGNAATATKLATARKLWGQSFDGTANVSGSLSGVTTITHSGVIAPTSNNSVRLGSIENNYTAVHSRQLVSNVSDTPLWIWQSTEQAIAFSTNATERMRITEAGNVGIGTATPTYKLDVSGHIRTTQKLYIGTSGVYIEVDANGHLHTNAGFYSDSFVSALGAGSASAATAYDRLDAWADYTSAKSGWVLSAALGYDLYGRVTAVEVGSALNVSVGGSGNAVTDISKSGTTITATKGATFATTSQLSGYIKTDGSNGTADGVSALINKLTLGTSIPSDDDYYVCQWANGGTTTTTYHRRPMSALATYVKGKLSASTSGSGNAVTAVSYSGGTITVTKGSTFALSGGSNASGTWGISISGNASTATRLADSTACTAWGQTYWSGGKPQSISGSLSGVENIATSTKGAYSIGSTGLNFRSCYANYFYPGTNNNLWLLRPSGMGIIFATGEPGSQVEFARFDSSGNLGIGTGSNLLTDSKLDVNGNIRTRTSKIYFGTNTDAYIEYANGCFHFSKGLYSDEFVSALGAGSGGNTASGTLDSLTDTDLSGLTGGDLLVYNASKGKWERTPQSAIVPNLSGYATESWVTGKGYLTSHQSIYTLTLSAGAFSAGSYTPNSAAKTIYVPTTTDHISEGSNKYFTSGRVTDIVTQSYVNGLGINASTLGGTALGGLLTSVSLSASQLAVTVGGVTKTASVPTWNQNTTGNAATATNAANADTLDGYHEYSFVKIQGVRFTQHNQGYWTKILTFTVPSGSLQSSISFAWNPSECARDAWADFNINIRSFAVIFMAQWKGTAIRTLKCVGDGTTYSVWVSGSKTNWDPYGQLQVTSTWQINSYSAGSLDYSDNEPTDTYEGFATVSGVAAKDSAGNTITTTYLTKAEFAQYFTKDSAGDIKAQAGFYTESFVSALGKGSGGTGASGTLESLTDTQTDTAVNGDILVYDGSKWVSRAQSSIVPNVYPLTLSAGAFSAATYDPKVGGSVNIPTHTSHLTNNSGFITSSALSGYLPLSGGTMTTASVIGNLNADMLDGWHGSGSSGYALKKSGYVVTPTSLSSYWAKIASFTWVGQYDDRDVTLYIHSAFQQMASTVLLRGRWTSTTDYNVTCLITSGNIPASRLRLYYDPSSVSGAIELWGNVNKQYGVFNTRILSETSRTSNEQGYVVVHSKVFTEVQTPTLTQYIEATYANHASSADTASTATSASTATRLADSTACTAWGQTYWSGGKPQSISGSLSGVENIATSTKGAYSIGSTGLNFRSCYANYFYPGTNNNLWLLRPSGMGIIFATGEPRSQVEFARFDSSGNLGIGTGSNLLTDSKLDVNGNIRTRTSKIYFGTNTDAYIEYANGCFHFSKGLYSDEFVSALGAGSSSGSTGGSDVYILDNLNDVTISTTTLANGNMLMYSGSQWVNIAKADALSGYVTDSALSSTLSGYVQTSALSSTLSGYVQTSALSSYLKVDGSNGTAAGVSALINKLTLGTSIPSDDDYYVCQWANGGTSTTSYHRRPMSALATYVKGKLSASTSGSGNAVTAVSYSGGTITVTKGTTFATASELTSLTTRVSGLESYNSSTLPSTYLAKSGGTMTGQIQHGAAGTSWVNGRTAAALRINAYSGYTPMLSQKTTDGSWELGAYSDNTMYLVYITDTNFSAGNNVATHSLTFPKSSGTLATENFVTNKGYATQDWVTGKDYANTTYVQTQVGYVGAAVGTLGNRVTTLEDFNTNTLPNNYIQCSGGTMTGIFTAASGQSSDGENLHGGRKGAIDLNGSNIIGVNSLYTNAKATDATSGIHFYNTAAKVDTLTSSGGVLYYYPSRSVQTSLNVTDHSKVGFGYAKAVLHSGNYNSYSPSLTGSGASGTWGISISGNAASASTAAQLTTSHTIWGRSFNGTANVSGDLVLGSYSIQGYNNCEVLNCTGDASVSLNAAGGSLYIGEENTANVYFYANDSLRMTINSSGNVGIGTSTLNFKLNVGGTAKVSALVIDSAVFSYNSDSYVQVNKDFCSTGAITALASASSSDLRLKSNITSQPLTAEQIAAVRPVAFDFSQGDRHVGVIAQELQPLLPDAVKTAPNGYLSVEYGNAAMFLVLSLAAEVKRLKARIAEQQATINELLTPKNN